MMTILKKKILYPNVDFYSGILLLKALGIPTSMFTPIFAVGRTSWMALPMEGNDRR